ncbi:hypothetical protein [Mixta calida]|uniref:hypothetical protein n=1 Tax=Mixta calida TaxID=665913 RepID=UPI002FDC85C2
MTQKTEEQKETDKNIALQLAEWNKNFPVGAKIYKLRGKDKNGKAIKLEDTIGAQAESYGGTFFVTLKKTGSALCSDIEAIHQDDADRKSQIYLSSILLIVALLIYASLCAHIIFTENPYSVFLAAAALTASLAVRAFYPDSKSNVLRVLKLLGDWVAVTFTLSTLLKPLACSPFTIVFFTFVLCLFATVTFFKET